LETSFVPFSELLSEVIDNRGRTCPTSDTGIPLIATNCIRNDLLYPVYEKIRYVSPDTYETWFRGHPKPGDLILVLKGTPGRICIAPDPVDFCIAQDMVALRVDESRVYPKYLFALLRSAQIQSKIEQMHVGTLIPHFKKGDFDKLLLPIPNREAQYFIGDLYFTLSSKIDVNRRMTEVLDGIARALFQSWFVDFDPVRAKVESRDTTLAKSIADLFPDSFEDSEIGEIPAGWSVGTIEKLAEVNALTLSRTDPLDPIDYVEISEVMLGEIRNIIRYERGSEPSRARRRLRHGDSVLSTVRPDRGSYFLALNPPETLVASTGFAVLTPKNDHWAFLHSLATRREVGDQLGRLADGGAYPAIRPEVVGQISVAIPPTSEPIVLFEKLVRPLYEKSGQNRGQSRTLGQLRDAVLPKLISGELLLPDAERIVGGRCNGAL